MRLRLTPQRAMNPRRSMTVRTTQRTCKVRPSPIHARHAATSGLGVDAKERVLRRGVPGASVVPWIHRPHAGEARHAPATPANTTPQRHYECSNSAEGRRRVQGVCAEEREDTQGHARERTTRTASTGERKTRETMRTAKMDDEIAWNVSSYLRHGRHVLSWRGRACPARWARGASVGRHNHLIQLDIRGSAAIVRKGTMPQPPSPLPPRPL